MVEVVCQQSQWDSKYDECIEKYILSAVGLLLKPRSYWKRLNGMLETDSNPDESKDYIDSWNKGDDAHFSVFTPTRETN